MFALPPANHTCVALFAAPHLSQATLWLGAHLTSSACEGQTVLVVSHDRAFLDTVAQEMVLFKDKQLRCAVSDALGWGSGGQGRSLA